MPRSACRQQQRPPNCLQGRMRHWRTQRVWSTQTHINAAAQQSTKVRGSTRQLVCVFTEITRTCGWSSTHGCSGPTQRPGASAMCVRSCQSGVMLDVTACCHQASHNHPTHLGVLGNGVGPITGLEKGVALTAGDTHSSSRGWGRHHNQQGTDMRKCEHGPPHTEAAPPNMPRHVTRETYAFNAAARAAAMMSKQAKRGGTQDTRRAVDHDKTHGGQAEAAGTHHHDQRHARRKEKGNFSTTNAPQCHANKAIL